MEKSIALFFTRSMSVSKWHALGMLGREKKLYEQLLEQGVVSTVYWLTYDYADASLAHELKNQGALHDSIMVLPKPRYLIGCVGDFLFSIFSPCIYRKELQSCELYKSNQMDGSWSALIAALLFRRPFYLRTGYTKTLFMKQQGKLVWKRWIFHALEYVLMHCSAMLSVTTEDDKYYLINAYAIPEFKIQVIPSIASICWKIIANARDIAPQNKHKHTRIEGKQYFFSVCSVKTHNSITTAVNKPANNNREQYTNTYRYACKNGIILNEIHKYLFLFLIVLYAEQLIECFFFVHTRIQGKLVPNHYCSIA